MRVETIVQPRRDGTVCLTTPTGATYRFAPDEDGRLIAEVDAEHVGWMLALGDFFPADDDDSVVPGGVGVPPPMSAETLSELLANLDKSGLIEYARQNDIAVDGRTSVGALRAKIAEAMSDRS